MIALHDEKGEKVWSLAMAVAAEVLELCKDLDG